MALPKGTTAVLDLHNIKFVQAKWYTPVVARRPRVIVIHTMEAPEKGTTAQNVADYFHNGCDGRKASAHYCIDNATIRQSVQCCDVAYGAPNMNRLGIHLEHAGYAKQSLWEWQDAFSMSMLYLSAMLCSKALMPKFKIKPVWLSSSELRDSASNLDITGFCTHADVTRAFNTPGGHTDPGINFPRERYMAWVRQGLNPDYVPDLRGSKP
jgi:hypothetical protein